MRAAGVLAAACAVAVAVAAAGCGGSASSGRGTGAARSTVSARSTIHVDPRPAAADLRRRAPLRPHGPYAVGERVITFVDRGRRVRIPGHGREPRTLVTVVRYPSTGPPSRVDVRDAPPDRAAGPFPLVIFGHGFAVTPAVYYRLLRAWAAAGFVVAAPVFPLENAHAPGGPDEHDLVNQPRDVRFVISGLLAASASPQAWLAGAIDPREIAVTGQSDGGETALAVGYDRFYRDPRVRAAVILSGARIPGDSPDQLSAQSPPLLATQGTADAINRPVHTYRFFAVENRPKFLLKLLGAPHLPPYTDEQPQLGIVERVSIAFLDRYLRGTSAGIAGMRQAGNQPGTSVLVARP